MMHASRAPRAPPAPSVPLVCSCQVILLPTVAPRHQSAAFVFTEFQGAGLTRTGLGNNCMIFFVGMLMAQFA